jgi:hypothetical protein
MFRRFANLPTARRRLLPVALSVLTAVRLLLLLIPFRFVRRAIARARVPIAFSSVRVADVAWAIEIAALGSRAVNTCLAEALAADVLLRSAGVAGQLRFAAGRHLSGRFSAHAWLELPDGSIVGTPPPADVTLTPLRSAS